MNVMPADANEKRPGGKYERLIALARAIPAVSTIVVHPCDESSLRGAVEAAEAGIIKPILVGPAAKIRDTAAKHNLNISGFEIVDAVHSEEAAAKGVELIHAAKGEMLMKGSLHTDELMRSVTAKVGGLRTDRRISHVFVMDVPAYAETLFVTDAAINIFPDLDAKRDFHPRSRRRRSARWQIAGRSLAVCLTDRLPSTTPSMWKRHGSRESNPRSPAGHRSCSFLTLKPVICWRRIWPTSPRRMVLASCLAPGCLSS